VVKAPTPSWIWRQQLLTALILVASAAWALLQSLDGPLPRQVVWQLLWQLQAQQWQWQRQLMDVQGRQLQLLLDGQGWQWQLLD
jgi:hypothetical protein